MTATSLLLVLLATAGGDEVVARVDGVAILRSTLDRRVQAAASGRSLRPEEALDQLVVEALLATEGRRLGLSGSPEATGLLRQRLRAAAVDVMLDEVVAKATIPNAMLREMFHATSDFASFDSLVYETREEAEAAFARIRDDGNMAEEAPRAVMARLSPKPEEAPPVMRAEIEGGLARALFAARPGQLIGPVQLSTGWALARLHRKEVGSDAQFSQRRAALERHAAGRIRAEARKHFADQLRARAEVKLDEAFLRGLQGTDATPKQLDHVIAMVGQSAVRYRDIYPTVRSLATSSGHMAGGGLKIAVAWQTIEGRLLEEAAVERGMLASPRLKALEPEIERAAIAAVVVDRVQDGAPAPTEKEIEAFYRRNAAAYGVQLRDVRKRVIVDATAEKRAAELSRKIAELRQQATIATSLAAEGLDSEKRERP